MLVDILLFGGNFDPPHNAHVSFGKILLEQNFTHAVHFVPAADDRYDKKSETKFKHRIEMLKKMHTECFQNDPRIHISEAQNNPKLSKSYAIDLVKSYIKENPGKKIGFVIGSDNLSTISKWKNAAELIKLAQIFVVPRTKFLSSEELKIIDKMGFFGVSSAFFTPLTLSSTELREKLKARQSINSFLPESVCEYIKLNKLYLS